MARPQDSLPAYSLKQFRAQGCTSYIVGDRVSGEVAIVDPVLDLMDAYRVHIAEMGLKVLYVLETHTHSDHPSAGHAIRAEFGAKIAMLPGAGHRRADLSLSDAQEIALGSCLIQVISTPGHTADSACFLLGHLLFTGDTVLVGGTGRWDAPDGDPGLLWRSLNEKLARLDSDLVVLPAHGCSGHLFSTLRVEREKNPDWRCASEEALKELKQPEYRDPPSESVLRHMAFNSEKNPPEEHRERTLGGAWVCSAASPEGDPFTVLGVEKFKRAVDRLESGALLIDVREKSEFEQARIEGSQNVPLSEIALRLPELRAASKVLLVCQSGRRSQNAAQTLSRVGLANVIQLKGGLQAWRQAGYEVVVP
jgi:glyoxylase-like metal-dependent hydrolase (beta-lactamase superfamily II)/rhodanese-related sulfurtransferase